METRCPERESTVTSGILPFIFIHLSQSCRVFYFLCCYAKVGCFFFFFNYSKRKPSCSGRLTCTLLSLWFKRTFSGVRSLHHGSLLLLQGFLAEVEPGKLLENENGNMMNLTEGCPLSSHFKASSHTAQSGTLVRCLFDLSFRHVQSIYVQTYVLWTWIRRLWQSQDDNLLILCLPLLHHLRSGCWDSGTDGSMKREYCRSR